ncbi:MAG: DUF3796 domain-containing protein [Paraclostridium sp.]|uniref:DUF3796 domain-containing protein n=1 Tax=Paraclostridium sp. TaxID=2023273 RepID=UPI003F2A6759
MKNNLNRFSFLLGFLGLLGFKGFYNDPLDFLYFAFFGFFSEFWWLRLGDFTDEISIYNRYKAGFISFKLCLVLIFLLSIVIYLFSSNLVSVYKLQLLIIPIIFSISSNLWAFLTYKFCLRS